MDITFMEHTKTPSESVARLKKALGQKEAKVLHYGKAVDKLTQYAFFKEHNLPHPEWTTDPAVAKQWQQVGDVVFARETVKTGTGTGIIIVQPEEALPEEDIKVYTRYIKKKREFRVNLFDHKIVNIREKLKGVGKPTNFYIRNKANGFTTAHCLPMSPELEARCKELAIQAAKVSESSFIGVDLGYNLYKDLLFVLEVNSGPSIEGSSVQEFAEAICKNEI